MLLDPSETYTLHPTPINYFFSFFHFLFAETIDPFSRAKMQRENETNRSV